MTAPKISLPTTTANSTTTSGVLYTVTAVVFFFGIVHAIVGAILDWPPQLVTMHIGGTIVIGLLGWRAEIEQRRRESLQELSELEQGLSEIELLELWANKRDHK